MHPGSEEDISLDDTGIEMADESDIKRVYERDTLLRRVQPPKRSCLASSCRICMGITATAVFCFMLIQLWASYGDAIKQRVLAPVVSSAGCFDAEGAHGSTFLLGYHKWDNTTLHLNATKPLNEMVQVNMEQPQEWSYEWSEDCLKITLEKIAHVNVMVWSI